MSGGLLCALIVLNGMDQGRAAPTPAETVAVHGMSPRAVSRSVALLLHRRRDRQLARWQRAVCAAVVGLKQPFEAIVRDRLAG